MKRTILLCGLFLIGCAGPIMLVNLKTGERITCSGNNNPYNRVSPGLTLLTTGSYTESCAKQYEGLGFVRADNLTPEQRTNLVSKPTPIGIEQDVTIRQAPPK
jgi:hypothetical protein